MLASVANSLKTPRLRIHAPLQKRYIYEPESSSKYMTNNSFYKQLNILSKGRMYLFPFNSYNQEGRTLPLIVFQTKISLARDPRGIEMGLGIVSSLPDTTPTKMTKGHPLVVVRDESDSQLLQELLTLPEHLSSDLIYLI